MKTGRLAQLFGAASLMLSIGFSPVVASAQEHNQPSHTTENPSAEHPTPSHSEHGTTTEHAPGPGSPHGEHAEHGDGHGGHATGPEPINWTEFGGTRRDPHTGATKPNPPPFIALLLNFALVVVVLYLAVQRLINPALAARRAAVQAELSEAQRQRTEAEKLRAEYQEKLNKLVEEAEALKAEFVRSGEAEHAKIIAEATARAEKIEADAVAQLQQELRQLQAEVRRQAIEAAMNAAETAVQKHINTSDQSRIADTYLTAIESEKPVGGQA